MSLSTADDMVGKGRGCYRFEAGYEAAGGGVLFRTDNSQIRAKLKEHKIVVNNVLNKFYELNALWFERGLNRSLR